MKKNNLDTRSMGLDVGLGFVKWLTGAENLHYGLWDNLSVDAMNVRAAQEAYTSLLFDFLPNPKMRILDVGGGAGETAKKLIDLGHDVEIVIPSELLADRCRENAPQAIVHEMKFQDFESMKTFDLVLFSESFQYIPLDIALSKSKTLLTPQGKILIADCFRREDFVREKTLAQVGDGHKIDLFYDAIKSNDLNIERQMDISASVAPSIEIEQKFYHILGYGWSRFNDELEVKKPFVKKVFGFVLKMLFSEKRRVRTNQRFNQNTRTVESFLLYNEYHIFLLS